MLLQRALVFDSIEWSRTGDCLEGHDNDCFYRSATIVKERSLDLLVDVVFDHRSTRVSRGHYTRGIIRMPEGF